MAGDPFSVNYRYAACRGPIRHRWDLIPSSPHQRPPFGTLALFRCDRCGTLRFDVFSRLSGELLTRRYEHPDGYKLTDAPTSAELRALWALQTRDERLLDAENVTPFRRARKRA